MQAPIPAPTQEQAPIPPSVQRAAYGLEEVLEMIPISRSYLFELIREREIAIVKLGRRTLVPHEEISRLIANHLKPAL